MRKFVRITAVAIALIMLAAPSVPNACGGVAAAQGYCCKVCRAGKACGDSCISVDKVCHKGAGCACDG